MNCPSCTFANLPGSASCARCGARVCFDGIDVEPPRNVYSRAGRVARRAVRGVRDDMIVATDRSSRSLRAALHIEPRLRSLALTAVPGLGHVAEGARCLGLVLHMLWIGLLVGAALNVGTLLGWAMFSWAVGVHCTAFTLLLGAAEQSYSARVRRGVGLFALLVGAIYLPSFLALRNVASPLRIPEGVRPGEVRTGEIYILTSRWTRPDVWEIGDVVSYQITSAVERNLAVASGIGFDRIVAGPGDRIELKDGMVLVNGAPAEHSPLCPVSHLTDFEMVVPNGAHAILPSMFTWRSGGYGAVRNIRELMKHVAIVESDQINGRSLGRVRPLWGSS